VRGAHAAEYVSAMRRVLVLSALFALSCAKLERSAPREGPRHVFIDGGAHLGETVAGFQRSKLYGKHTWSIVSFEPNPELAPLIPRAPNLTVLEEAIWTKDETLEFKFSHQETLGGSVVDSVVPFPEMTAVKVKAIDFGQWLARTYRREDVVFVKLDIEGAEYPVLEQMLHDGTIAWVDRLYLEFHGVQQAIAAKKAPWEIVEVQKKDHLLVEAITSRGIPISLHVNEEPQGEYFAYDPEQWGQPWP
jgi:FkbM family methyltransferase